MTMRAPLCCSSRTEVARLEPTVSSREVTEVEVESVAIHRVRRAESRDGRLQLPLRDALGGGLSRGR